MNPVVLIAALIGAGAILLIFWGLFGARRDEVQDRLERYASPGGARTEKTEEKRKEQQNLLEQLAGSRALLDLNKIVERRDWGANLARELARADLALKPSEFLAIRLGAIVGLPAITFLLGATILPSLGNPLAWVAGHGHRLVAAPLLAQPTQEPAAQGVQQPPRRHHHAHRQLAASRLVVPAVHRDGGPRDRSRPSPPSSTASSGRSTWACPSSRRSTTWPGACAPMTWS